VSFGKIAHNGKSIGEVRAKMNEKFNFDQTKPMLFLGTKLQKNVESKSSGGKILQKVQL